MQKYFTGLTEGEGCFSISFNFKTRLNLGIEVRPSFSLTLNQRDLELTKKVHEFFGCGSIRFSKQDRCYKYETRCLSDLHRKIIYHFDRFPLMGSKQKDYLIFRSIVFHMRENGHKNPEILKNIISQAYMMNPSGKRKYNKEELLSKLDENKV